MKKYWWVGIIILMLLVGVGLYLCQPRYKVIQETRSLSWGNQPSGFIMSPAKIEVTNLCYGFPLTIPVKIINSAGNMNYSVCFQDPSIFDKGYISADGNNDYSYSWNKSTMDVKNNTTEVVNIKISKRSLFGTSGIEKGIAISQRPNGGQVNVGFSYVFEILIK